MEDVFSDVTFTNDRQKADVNVVKKDNDTENPLSGGILALYVTNCYRGCVSRRKVIQRIISYSQ